MTLLSGWLIKVFLLLLIGMMTTIIIFFLHFLFIKQVSLAETFNQFQNYFLHTSLATDSLLYWLVMLLSAQIIVEIDQKYSPGVFLEILTENILSQE
jgi:adenylate cyclase